MKKALLLLLVGLLFCTGVAFSQTTTLPAFSLVLEDGFQHGINYLNYIVDPNLMKGHRIQSGESYTLKITFTATRDLEQSLLIGFLDRSPPTYWQQLSWNDGQGVRLAQIDDVKAGVPVTATIELRTLRRAATAAPEANALAFITEGAGRRGRAGGGEKGPVTLNFTEFVLTKN